MRFASVLAIPSRALNTIADSLVTRFGAPFCYTLWETCVSTWWSVRTPDEPKSTPSEASAKPPGQAHQAQPAKTRPLSLNGA